MRQVAKMDESLYLENKYSVCLSKVISQSRFNYFEKKKERKNEIITITYLCPVPFPVQFSIWLHFKLFMEFHCEQK